MKRIIFATPDFGVELMNTGQFGIYRGYDGVYTVVYQDNSGIYLNKLQYMDIIMDYFCNMVYLTS